MKQEPSLFAVLDQGEPIGAAPAGNAADRPSAQPPSTGSQLPPDEGARRTIRGSGELPVSEDPCLVLDRNLVVRAGAGSGKTRSLVDRMVALVRAGVPVGRLASITFTIKAAGELRLRFSRTLRAVEEMLKTRAEDHPDRWLEELERVQEAQDRLQHCFIGTVHAFAGRILRERPFTAGLSPDFSHLDPGVVLQHRRAFWAGYLSQASDAWVDRFEESGVDPADLFEFFSNCVNNEDVKLEGLALQPPLPDLKPATSEVSALVSEIRKMAGMATRTDDLQKQADTIARVIDREGLDSPLKQARVLKLAAGMAKSSNVKVTYWGPRTGECYAWAKDLRDRIESWSQDVIQGPLTAWQEYVFYDVGRFVEQAVKEYSADRKRLGEQTFDDLLWGARAMLADSAENRAHFSRKFSHLLVDEFQDTDPVQAEILLFLTSENRSERNPWKCRPRPGSLFIVGDDKQSIYRFRRADVAVFQRFEEVLIRHGGGQVALTTNFRSDPRVCDFVNRCLRPAFSHPFKEQAEWEDLVPFEGTQARAHTAAVARIALPEGTHKRQGAMAAADAPLVAAAISQLVANGEMELEEGGALELAGPVGFGDVLVLFRTASSIPIYTDALNALGIPYSISGGKTLGKTETLRLLLDPLDAVLNDDPVALLAFLRGPFCGATDAELVDLVEEGGSLRMPLRRDSPITPPESVGRGFEAIWDLETRLQTEAPADAIEGWVYDHGAMAVMGLVDGGAAAAGSMLRLLALVRHWDAMGLTWPEIVQELSRLMEAEVEAEQLSLDALDGDAVRLMTVHQAKGLEARVVVLADPLGSGRTGSDMVVDRSRDVPSLGCRVVRWDSDLIACTPGWKQAEEKNLALEEAEELRIAYVAATRAQELLLLSHHTRADGPWEAFGGQALLAPAFGGEGAPQGVLQEPEVSASSLGQVVEEIESQAETLSRLSRPTYVQKRASEDGEAFQFQPTGEGKGRSFGTLIHLLFESLVRYRHQDLDGSWVQRVAARHAADTIEEADRAARVADALRAAEAFLNSEVWQAVLGADEVHVELPYAFSEPAPEDSGMEVVHTGAIDLAYRRGHAWFVVDYKTDPLEAEDLRERHGVQVSAYVRALQLLADAREVTPAIWSVHLGQLVAMDPAP